MDGALKWRSSPSLPPFALVLMSSSRLTVYLVAARPIALIKLGRGLVGSKGRLGMLDTETGRGKIYAKLGGGFDYAELTPPFTPARYTEAIEAAEAAGIEALMLDSGSTNGKELAAFSKWPIHRPAAAARP